MQSMRSGVNGKKYDYICRRKPNLQMAKKRIMLTGSTGVMGSAGLKELMRRHDRFDLTLLVRDSRKNRRLMALYRSVDGVRIIWGDLRNYDDVRAAVDGADYILHIGGMVSPIADRYPAETMEVNIRAAENIVRAVKAQPDPDHVKVVYIGSVAQTGDRRSPVHWGRTGDPICPSIYDHYAVSKCTAERIVAESGLKYWVSLRQSGILYPGIMKKIDPIMFHVPNTGVLEWATVEDSGVLLANVCEEWVPEEFWNRFYNIGSGEQYRLTNYEFEKAVMRCMSCPTPRKAFKPEWFALRNFHGQWYLDSDRLDDMLHFRRNIPIDDYFAAMRRQQPWYYALAPLAPAFLIRAFMSLLTRNRHRGTISWIRRNDTRHIAAYFGSVEEWRNTPSWDEIENTHLAGRDEATILDHGYDESKPLSELDIEDMRRAARFRGGKCLSGTMSRGDMNTPLEWECRCGHRFKATPTLVLLGGHWCPECMPSPWNYDEEARHNPFFAQIWTPLHRTDENNFYDDKATDE